MILLAVVTALAALGGCGRTQAKRPPSAAILQARAACSTIRDALDNGPPADRSARVTNSLDQLATAGYQDSTLTPLHDDAEALHDDLTGARPSLSIDEKRFLSDCATLTKGSGRPVTATTTTTPYNLSVSIIVPGSCDKAVPSMSGQVLNERRRVIADIRGGGGEQHGTSCQLELGPINVPKAASYAVTVHQSLTGQQLTTRAYTFEELQASNWRVTWTP